MRELERDSPNRSDVGDDVGALLIVGAGRVGSSLAAAARRAGIEVELAGRGEAERGGAAVPGPPGSGRPAGAVLICTPDAAIAAAAADLAAAGHAPRFAGHTSGATPLAALAPLADRGAAAFSLHPLQTVPAPDTDLAGAPCAITGDGEAAVGFARRLAATVGLRPFELADDSRAAYHAAAAIASNFLITLQESAAALLATAGIDADPRQLLAPLVTRTAANWAADGPAALTGPIARGDQETIDRHREALREAAPELLPLYEELAARTRAIAASREAAAAGSAGG